MGRIDLPRARIPLTTYRLQFNAGFTFRQAEELLPYLKDLGVTDVYSSPCFAAKRGSIHGYDIVDHNRINPEIGTEEEFERFTARMREMGMGQIIDFVPNHMCVESSDNKWWQDVLENGRSALHAGFFDINWDPVKKELKDKVLVPLLGDQYGTILERGELSLAFDGGAFFVCYYDARFPVEPSSYLRILRHRLESIEESLPANNEYLLELLSIITALQHLPSTLETDQEKREERNREKEIVKKRLHQLVTSSRDVSEFLTENVRIFNGIKGDPRSYDLLDGLLRQQVYRLSYWRVATEEINFRRFFDINGLGAIRMEDPAVFAESHQLLFRLVREEKVTGIRIDHIDGLFDPHSYLHNLQKGCFRELCRSSDDGAGCAESLPEYPDDPAYRPFYLIGEKILLKGERLPDDWPVAGTTGYDFVPAVTGLFVETENARVFDRIFARFTRGDLNFSETVYEKKKLVMTMTMSGEINTLGNYLNGIAQKDRLTRDFTLNSLTRAITEVIAFFPVYRTYVNSASVREKDVQYIETAVAKAKRKNPVVSSTVFDFIRSVLLLRFPADATDEDRKGWLDFVMKFQQLTGPVMAKGLEDTTFYVYNRLVSLNDVGGIPERFGIPLDTFHGQNLERLKSFTHSMINTATHDSKRGEDVRARINALSEIPEKWWKSLVSWSRMNRGKKGVIDGQAVPDRNEEYLLYQTLVGAWPPGDAASETEIFGDFVRRITEYMIKAIREAKVNTSWINPNLPYEEGVTGFVAKLLDPSPGNHFLQDFKPFQSLIAHYGCFTSLSQTLLKICSPGTPDFYQGTELWDLHLVDPDNRGQVDYRLRGEILQHLKQREAEVGARELVRELVAAKEDGRIKLYVIYKGLNCRRANRELFEKGDYLALDAHGRKARNVCAFGRASNGKRMIVAVPRFMATLVSELSTAPWNEEVWGETWLSVPEGWGAEGYRNLFTGEPARLAERHGVPVLPLAEVFYGCPVAILEPVNQPSS